MPRAVLPYGSWRSPITAALLVGESVGLGAIAVSGDDLYWAESRPAEAGRTAIVQRSAAGTVADVLPQPWSARSRVHEYGGGAWTVERDTVYFVDDRDQSVFACLVGTTPRRLTEPSARRYADLVVDRPRARLIAVCEEHHDDGREPTNTLVAVPLDGSSRVETLVAGHDFYASPRLSPDGTRLAWLAWRHPHMPWDETELWLGRVAEDGRIVDARCIAGGRGESIFQPEWSPDGMLYFVADRTGWWNLYRWSGEEAQPLCPMRAEFGLPQWNFGMTTYGFASASSIVCTYAERGEWRLARLAIESGRLERFDVPFVAFSGLRVTPRKAYFVAGSPAAPSALIELDLESGAHRAVRGSSTLAVDPADVSIAQSIEFPSANGRTAYAFYYPPANGAYAGPERERPPLRVRSHGGPTAATDGALKLPIQYWTSRGFAVLDVNYSGSTGYGREYRDRLRGAWGVVDVEDCVAGARYVCEQGLADPARATISGGSAGGYTTLCALVFHDFFRAGASHYGIGDLTALAADTHKFESRYTDSLVAPYPEGAEIYRARSPLFHAERLSCPVIFFQGLEDRVVPPAQAEAMVAALRAKRLPVAYVAFPGEQHGFRRAENIRRALEAELYFFSRVLRFALAEPIEPVAIENL
ncbi:MAG TPA: S9 family peptidase [Candidatus Binatia bacterium]